MESDPKNINWPEVAAFGIGVTAITVLLVTKSATLGAIGIFVQIFLPSVRTFLTKKENTENPQ